MDRQYVIALDQGTTSSRSIVFDRNGMVRGMAQLEFPQIYPQPGWVEHDPDQILYTQLTTAWQALENAGIQASEVAAIGITNQRETTLVWDRNTGEPVYNAIVWQCRRTAEVCAELQKDEALCRILREKTGLRADAYFSATKIAWILDHVPGVRERAQRGELLFGTVDTFLLWHLTGVHATDYTNAARTLLFNIQTLSWDQELLDLFRIPASMLPQVYPSVGCFGETKVELFGRSIPVCGIAGDQHAALFGQACFDEGEAKNTYGTGCFLMMNTGSRPVFSERGLLTTIAWATAKGPVYALEGSVFVGGAVLQWLRDELGLIDSAREADLISERAENGGVYLVPAFTGLGAPYWDMYARGCLTGLTRGTSRDNIVRAALESIAYQSYDLISAMAQDIGRSFRTLKVDGGASRSDVLMQFQADLLEARIDRPSNPETTAQGAAFMAGLGVGLWKDVTELKALCRTGKSYDCQMDAARREQLLDGWHKAVGRTLR